MTNIVFLYGYHYPKILQKKVKVIIILKLYDAELWLANNECTSNSFTMFHIHIVVTFIITSTDKLAEKKVIEPYILQLLHSFWFGEQY